MSKWDSEVDNEIIDIKPTSDIFIAVFLSAPKNEPILAAVINAVLTDSGWERIVSATVLNPFNVTEYAVEKRIVLDVRVRDEKNRFYNIEIQTYPHPAFKHRILFGWADSYSSQMSRGNHYTDLEPVFSIVIAEFPIFQKSKKIHLEFEAREKDDHKIIFSNHFQVHVLRLHPLLYGRWEMLEGVAPELVYWLLFLVLGKKDEVEMSQIAEKYPIVREAFSDPLIQEAVSEFHRFQSDPKMRELERQRRLFMVGYHQDISVSRAEGKAEGKAEGEAKGKAEGEAKGKAETIIRILSRRLTAPPKALQKKIASTQDIEKLDKLIDCALTCATLDEFTEALN